MPSSPLSCCQEDWADSGSDVHPDASPVLLSNGAVRPVLLSDEEARWRAALSYQLVLRPLELEAEVGACRAGLETVFASPYRYFYGSRP